MGASGLVAAWQVLRSLARLPGGLGRRTVRSMNVAPREPWTVERFLAWEDKQEGKHEFDGARIIAVSGNSRGHQRVVSNLLRLLGDTLDPDRFDAVQAMRIKIGRKVRYPDVAVVAGPIPGQVTILGNALVLFEVLSDTTADTDRAVKPADYAEVASLRRYILLQQVQAPVAVLERTADGWAETRAATELALPELGITLPVAAMYRNVEGR